MKAKALVCMIPGERLGKTPNQKEAWNPEEELGKTPNQEEDSGKGWKLKSAGGGIRDGQLQSKGQSCQVPIQGYTHGHRFT